MLLFFGSLHFSDKIGHNAYQEEYREGYYQKVDNRLQERSVVERNGGSSIGCLFERNAQILEIDTPYEQSYGRHNHIRDQRRYYLTKCTAYNNTHGHVYHQDHIPPMMDGDVLVNAVLIPQKAVLITQKGSFVMTLDKDNVVGTQKVEVSETIGDMYLVDSGLKGGERIICEGMVKARPGAKVSVMGDGQAQKGQAAQKTAQK